MINLTLKIKLLDGFLPAWNGYADAGLDLKAVEDTPIAPAGIVLIRLGFITEFSNTYYASIRDRSGLALKGIHTLGGVVDSSYRGEWKVILVNLSTDDYVIRRGDRIAQAIFTPILHPLIEVTDTLTGTGRGASGFGASGQ